MSRKLIPENLQSIPLPTGQEVLIFQVPSRQVTGRGVLLDPRAANIKIWISPELLNQSFSPSQLESQASLNPGLKLKQLLCERSILPPYLSSSEVEVCIFACNALHTNFVRGNGFIIQDGRVISKPAPAVALDGEAWQALEGAYSILQLSPYPPKVSTTVVEQDQILEQIHGLQAISGPQMVRSGINVTRQIPFRLPGNGQTTGDEINFDPFDLRSRTSVTVIGLTQDNRLMITSFFAGGASTSADGSFVMYNHARGSGLSLSEAADIVIELGAVEAILGGGSGDTQQFLRGGGLWASLPRPQAHRPQVKGIRGLGAVLSVLQ